MGPSCRHTHSLFPVLALLALATVAPAADPGTPGTDLSDQKPGSLLVYNVYTSNPTNTILQNTRISVTNTDDQRGVAVHLFFVDGESCAVADAYICLSRNQTTSLLASEVDPGVSGYAIALAVNSSGLPIQFDRLIGDEYVKFATGHAANLGAEAVAAPQSPLVTFPVAGADDSAVTLLFDDVHYSRLPRVLAVDNIQSRSDGNDTLLIINRIGGDMRSSAAPIGKIFGLLFDELENGFSFSLSNLGCQVRRSLNNDFPRTAPRFNSVLRAGMTGWMKFWASTTADDPIVGTTTMGLLGAAINYNPNTGLNASLFNQGHNLHKLTRGGDVALIIPVFPPSCAGAGDGRTGG